MRRAGPNHTSPFQRAAWAQRGRCWASDRIVLRNCGGSNINHPKTTYFWFNMLTHAGSLSMFCVQRLKPTATSICLHDYPLGHYTVTSVMALSTAIEPSDSCHVMHRFYLPNFKFARIQLLQ